MKFTKDFGDDLSTSEGLFVKLNDGEKIKGVFRGSVVDRYVRWTDGRSEDVDESTAGASYRFKTNFLMIENGAWVSKIFEGSKTLYKQLQTLDEEYTLETTIVTITRNGTGKQTTYTVMPAKEHALTGETLAAVEAVDLKRLTPRDEIDDFLG